MNGTSAKSLLRIMTVHDIQVKGITHPQPCVVNATKEPIPDPHGTECYAARKILGLRSKPKPNMPAQSQSSGNSAEPSPDPDANVTVKAQAHGGPFFFGVGGKAVTGQAKLNEKLRGGTQEGSR